MDERIIVSPVAGIFASLESLPATVSAGTHIGFVRAGTEHVPVVSPFDGELVDVVAVDGERLEPYQRVAWLRAA